LDKYFKQIEMPFFKNKGEEGKIGPVWELVPVGSRGYKVEILCIHE
jgi:hypothetical protein